MLGCPNLPLEPITDADGAAGAAERVGTAGVGALFYATRGGGAFVGPLKPGKSAVGVCLELLAADVCSPQQLKCLQVSAWRHCHSGRALCGEVRD